MNMTIHRSRDLVILVGVFSECVSKEKQAEFGEFFVGCDTTVLVGVCDNISLQHKAQCIFLVSGPSLSATPKHV